VSFRPFTQAWADALRDVVNGDAAYRDAAARWAWPLAMVLEPAPAFGYAEPVAAELVLDRGTCHAATVLAPDAVTAPFVLRATYEVWKKVVRGELDPVSAVATGRIKFTVALMTLMLHTGAAKALLACAARVPTEFPDEA
jgi:putative sterol carrier protein